MTTQIVLPCGACQKMVHVMVSAQPKLLNMDSVSIIMIEHSTQVLCQCGATLQVAIAAVPNMLLSLVPVAPQQQQQIIIPPGVLTH